MERRTFVLAGVLAAIALADVGVRLDLTSEPPLPRLRSFQPLDPMKLVLTHGDDRVVISRRDKDWYVTEPFEGLADRQGVKAILGILQKGVPMDVLVQRGDHERYGFEGGQGLRVEIHGESTVIDDFYLGSDTTGDSSFLRFPADDAVYRARVGGRARYDRAPEAWRDLRVAGLDPNQVVRVTLERGSERFVFTRPLEPGEGGKVELGRWTISPAPAGFVLDQESAGQVAEGLARLRGGGLIEDPHLPPLVTATLETADAGDVGTATVVELGRDAEGAWAKRAGEPLVYRIADAMLERALAPVAAWSDRQLFAVPQAVRLVWADAIVETVVENDGTAWRVVRPQGASVDPAEIAALGKAVRGLRAKGIAVVAPTEAGFPSRDRFVVTGADGAVQTMEIGSLVPGMKPGSEARFVRTLDRPDRVCFADASAIARLKKYFGR